MGTIEGMRAANQAHVRLAARGDRDGAAQKKPAAAPGPAALRRTYFALLCNNISSTLLKEIIIKCLSRCPLKGS